MMNSDTGTYQWPHDFRHSLCVNEIEQNQLNRQCRKDWHCRQVVGTETEFVRA
jgi:hypothetical protein